MKTRNLVLTISTVALTAITFNATANDSLLSPRAAGNQIKTVAGTANDPNLVNTTGIVVLSPRVAGNQTKTVAGTSNDVNPAAACVTTMIASPKGVQACIESGTMAGCRTASVAAVK